MAEVTRRVIIEVETRQKRSRLEAPDAAAAERGFKAEADAAERAATSADKATESVKRHAETVRISSGSIVRDFREAGEGAFRMARGLTLLAASGGEDMKRLVQSVALAQGAFDVFAGGFKIYSSLAATIGGPFTLAIIASTAAITKAAVEWRKWQDAVKFANDAATEAIKRTTEAQIEQQKVRERSNQFEQGRADRALSFADSDFERIALLRGEIGRQEEIRRRASFQLSRATFRADTAGPEQAESEFRRLGNSADRQADLLKELVSIQRPATEGITRAFQGSLLGGVASANALFPLGGAVQAIGAGPLIQGTEDQLQRATDLYKQQVKALTDIARDALIQANELREIIERNPR